MIPLRDTTKTEIFPFVNITLIILNVLLYLYELLLGSDLSLFLYRYGLVPAIVTTDLEIGIFRRVYPFFTSMFLHGGFFHILGNMLFLYIFGDNIEDRMGHLRYLLFYIITGLIAALIQFAVSLNSTIPIIGASGAISGVLGAYLLFYPKARVLTIVPIFFFIQLIRIPATVFIFIWFFIQFIGGIGSVGRASDIGGVAFWAHIGGFLGGLIIAKYFAKYKRYMQIDESSYYRH